MSTSHICTDIILFDVFFGNIEKGLLKRKQNQFVLAEKAINVKIMKNVSSKSLQVQQKYACSDILDGNDDVGFGANHDDSGDYVRCPDGH